MAKSKALYLRKYRDGNLAETKQNLYLFGESIVSTWIIGALNMNYVPKSKPDLVLNVNIYPDL